MNINNHRKKLETYMEQLLVLMKTKLQPLTKKHKLQTPVK
jgi:hypothetical protein